MYRDFQTDLSFERNGPVPFQTKLNRYERVNIIMRTLHIDFTNNTVSYPDGALAGRRGEHLMTQLVLSLPEEMCIPEIEYYRIAFCRYGNEERILTNRITDIASGDRAYREGNTIYCKLWHDITDAQGLFFNVEGCQETDGEEVLLCKSPRARLGFQAAVSGEESSADTPLSSPRDGVSPTVTVSSNTATEYKLTIADQNGSITTPNLMGPRGPEGGITITRHRYPLSWNYKTYTNPDGSFLARRVWATIGDDTLLSDLQDRVITMSVTGIEGSINLTLPVFGATIPGVESPPFGLQSDVIDNKLCVDITGDDFLILAEEAYNNDEQQFKSNINFMFSHLIVLLLSEIEEG